MTENDARHRLDLDLLYAFTLDPGEVTNLRLGEFNIFQILA